MTGHTPGPWVYLTVDHIPPNSVYSTSIKGYVVSVAMKPSFTTSEQWAADARLIAAAPELLEELQSILEWALIEKAPLRGQEIRSIRAAIAKATGETP